MSQKTLNLCLERYNFVKFEETTKSSHTVLCINNAYSVNSDKYRLTPAAITSKHGEGYIFTLNYDFDRPLFTIVQKSYSLDGTSGNIVFEGIDPISKGGSKYLRKVTVAPVKLSDGSYLLEVTNDEYLRIGTTGAALGDEDLESLNEKIITMGGIEKSVENVGGKQVLKLDASGSSGAKEIVYFEVDPSNPPSGIYEAIGEALSNNKEPVIKNDGTVYFYSSTNTDKYVFVGGYNTEVVNYATVTVSEDDSVVKETVDTIEGMVFPLYYHSNDGEFTVADKTGHALTKTEIADAYRAGQIFMFSSYPASNTQAHWGYCCDINIDSDNTGYAEFFILAAFGGNSYEWEKYRINLSSRTEFVTLWGPNTSYSTGYSGSYASASDVTALQSQVSSLSDVSAYTAKGEATVAQLNAGPSGIQAGWAYQLTDSGTLTDGTLAVVAGDTVAWDGTKWFPLVKSDYYATKTYAQNVAHSIAPEFDPTRDSEHAYKAGESVTYTNGKVYTFTAPHYGAWTGSDVDDTPISPKVEDLIIRDKSIATYRICANDTGNALKNFVDEEGQEQTPRYRARNSVPNKYKRPGTIIEYRLNGNPVSEMYIGGFNYAKFLLDCYWMNLSDRKLLKDSECYYYNNNRVAVENYIKDVISSEASDLHLFFSLTTGKTLNVYIARYINGSYEKFVGKLVNLQITSSRETNSQRERIQLTKYASSDPDIYVVLDTDRIAKESVETFVVGSTSSYDILSRTSINISLAVGGTSVFTSVFNAVASHSQGLCSVGSIAGVVTNDNVTIPNTADKFVAKDINDAFSASLNDMALPVAGKQKFVQPMYNNEKLYVTAFSKKRMYLSLSPRLNAYENTTQYESQYMWFAEKTDLSELVQIQFPQYMVGGESNVVGRKHGLFELANGDALVEVENGPAVNANVRQINLYKISGFNGIAIVDGVKVVPPEAVTKVLTFVRNAHLTSFNNFQEYGEGCVILAPYGSGPTARLYLSKDYGSTFELIFCGDTSNAEVVAPKYEVTGDGTGAWPDAEHVVGSPIDWTKTLNGNIHIHGIAYDPYYDRIWLVTGDGNLGEDSVTGIWWTDDEGTTWHKYGTMVALTPFCAHGTQMIDVIPMPKCVLFATDGEGDGMFRYNRNGKNGTFSIEGCYQFTGVYSQLKCLGGRYCMREDGVVFQLHHPNTSSDPNIGGVVATLNGYDVHKICDDQFAELGDRSTYKINWNSVIGVVGRTVIVSSNSGGYITFEL